MLNRATLNQSNDNWKWYEEACDGDGGYIDIGSYYSAKSSKSTKSPLTSAPSMYTESSSKSSKSNRAPSLSKSSKSMSALHHLALSRNDEEEELLPALPMLTRRHIVKDDMINSDKSSFVETVEEFTGGLRRRHHRDLHSSHDDCECDDEDESMSNELIRHLLLPEAESEAVEYEVGEERNLSEASTYTLLPEAESEPVEYDIGDGKRHLASKCKCTPKTTSSSNSTTYGSSKSSKNITDYSYDYSSKSSKNSTEDDTAMPDYDDVSDRKTKVSLHIKSYQKPA